MLARFFDSSNPTRDTRKEYHEEVGVVEWNMTDDNSGTGSLSFVHVPV